MSGLGPFRETVADYARRVWDNAGEDNVFFLAGGIAFNILLAIVPFTLLLVTGLAYGHFPEKCSVPIGVRARLDASGAEARLTVLEPVVAEPHTAIEAYNVRITLGHAARVNRSDGTGQTTVPASKNQVKNAVDHRSRSNTVAVYEFSEWMRRKRCRYYPRYDRGGELS